MVTPQNSVTGTKTSPTSYLNGSTLHRILGHTGTVDKTYLLHIHTEGLKLPQIRYKFNHYLLLKRHNAC